MAVPAFIINQRKDPTMTLTLRARIIQDINARIARLKSVIRKKLIDEKFLGGTKEKPVLPENVFPFVMAAYTYERSALKVDQFMEWLQEQESQGILEVTSSPFMPSGKEAWSDKYIRSSYQSGLANARAQLRKEGIDVPSFERLPGGISSIMNQPFHADRVGLAYTRTFNGMKGVTAAMNQQLSRSLAKGMAEGKGPYQIAIDMVGTKKRPGIVDNIGRNRARLVARTEIVQSHNEGALNEFEATEPIVGENIFVQWWSALDEVVRPKHGHSGWHGMVMTSAEGRTKLGEPNCRCSLLPWVASHHEVIPTKITSAARSMIGDKLKPAKSKPIKDVVEWKPAMTKAEAEIWSAKSTAPGPYWHGTNSKSVKGILNQGFRLDAPEAISKAYGNGVYLSAEKDVAKRFSGPLFHKSGDILETRINVKKIYVVKDEADWIRHWDKAAKKNISFMKGEGVEKYFKSLSYDAVDVSNYEKLGGVIVFDPKNVVAVPNWTQRKLI